MEKKKREKWKPKLTLPAIKKALAQTDGDLIASAELLQIPLRSLLRHCTENRNLRIIMNKFKKWNQLLAQNKLSQAVKNDEQWAILFTLKQEIDEGEKGFKKPTIHDIPTLSDEELQSYANNGD
jgi:hypothetical protein